ncbi:MAG: hypothetical protein K6A63_01290 [Acholeplasmatales bacterium]|nr:hypothetical protein [Acholeplasmatales bacterium]
MKEKKLKNDELLAPKKLEILFTIVNRNKADFYMNRLETFDVNFQTLCYAKGSATTEMLQSLGITDDSKAVILSVVQEEKIKDILTAYEDNYFKTRGGKGIAFTVPMDSVIGVMVYRFLANISEVA